MKLSSTLRLAALTALVTVAGPAPAQDADMTYFVTSQGPGNGADLGGLDGADRHCRALADSAGAADRTWRAYLSTTGADGVDARDRIGDGPWRNANGVKVAADVEALRSDDNEFKKENSISETGDVIKAAAIRRTGTTFSPGRHWRAGPSTAARRRPAATGPTAVTTVAPASVVTTAPAAASIRARGTVRTARAAADRPICRGPAGDGLFYCFAAD